MKPRFIEWKAFNKIVKDKGHHEDFVILHLKEEYKKMLFSKVLQLSRTDFLVGAGCFILITLKKNDIDYDFLVLTFETERIRRLPKSYLKKLLAMTNAIGRRRINSNQEYDVDMAKTKLELWIKQKRK